MNLALWRKNWLDARLTLVACAVVIFAFAWIRVIILSRVETSRFAAIVEQLWDKWEMFSTIPLRFILTYEGRLSLTFVEPIITIGMAVWAIARGSDAVSGELGRGTLEMLLSQPLSRLQILLTQASVTIAGAAVLAVSCWLGVFVGVSTVDIDDERPAPGFVVPLTTIEIPNPLLPPEKVRMPLRDKVDARVLWPATFNLFCYGVCVAGLATLVSACDVYRWRTIGIAAGWLIFSIVAKLVGMSLKDIGWVKYASFLAAYEPERFTMLAKYQPDLAWSLWYTQNGSTELGPVGYSALLLGLGLIFYAAAAYAFCERDIPAPL